MRGRRVQVAAEGVPIGPVRCGRKAGYCPERKQTRADTGPTKSRAGRRIIGLPAPLVLLLQVHKAKQEAERMAARQLWRGEGWVFANPDGRPLNPNTTITSGRHS